MDKLSDRFLAVIGLGLWGATITIGGIYAFCKYIGRDTRNPQILRRNEDNLDNRQNLEARKRSLMADCNLEQNQDTRRNLEARKRSAERLMADCNVEIETLERRQQDPNTTERERNIIVDLLIVQRTSFKSNGFMLIEATKKLQEIAKLDVEENLLMS